MSELVLLAFALLLIILIPLVIWMRRRQKTFGSMLAQRSEAAMLREILDEQKHLHKRLDDLIDLLEDKAGDAVETETHQG